MALVERRYLSLYSVLVAIFTLFGTSMTVIGATLPRILADFAWGYGGAGLVMAANYVCYFVASYASGRLARRLRPRASFGLGVALVAGGLALFAAGPSLALNALLYAAIGIGQGFIEVNVNYVVVRMDEGSRALSLMHAAFSVGAVAGPFVVGALMAAGLPWTLVYRGMAAVFALVLAAVLLLPWGRLPADEAGPKAADRARGAAYVLGFVACFLYVGVELGVSNWIAELFVRVFGAAEALGSFMVSLFWLGLLAGRVGIPVLLPRARPARVLTALAVGLALSTGLLAAAAYAGPGARALAIAATGLAGLACSAIYPTIMALLGRAYPESPGEAIGFAGTGGGVGVFVFVFSMSRIAQAAGLQAGFAFYAAVAVLMAASAFALSAAVNRRAQAGRAPGARAG